MAVSFFDNKAIVPDDNMVAMALGESYSLWVDIQSHVKESYPNIFGEWKFYGKASGWSYKLLSKKRNVLFFVPLDGCFRIRVCLAEKTIEKVELCDLPEDVKKAYSLATAYTEGLSVDFDIGPKETNIKAYVKDEGLVDAGSFSNEPVEVIKKLLQIKFED